MASARPRRGTPGVRVAPRPQGPMMAQGGGGPGGRWASPPPGYPPPGVAAVWVWSHRPIPRGLPRVREGPQAIVGHPGVWLRLAQGTPGSTVAHPPPLPVAHARWLGVRCASDRRGPHPAPEEGRDGRPVEPPVALPLPPLHQDRGRGQCRAPRPYDDAAPASSLTHAVTNRGEHQGRVHMRPQVVEDRALQSHTSGRVGANPS